MSETITNGYLIFRNDYQLFDEVLGFINEYGNIFSVLALGTKKILSKNSRNLFYGCLSEFSFFASRDIDNNLGKLKKVILLENNITIANRVPLLLLNRIIYKNKIKGLISFNEIKKLVLNLNLYDYNFDDVLILNLLIKISTLLGIKINLNYCSICKQKNIYSFSNDAFGFVCKNHFNQNYKVFNSVLKLLYYSNLERFDLANKCGKRDKKIAIRMLSDYIDYHGGFSFYNYLFR